MKKNFSMLTLLSVFGLVACGTSAKVDTSYTANDNKTYAGYQADVNADGTISSDEKGLTCSLI